MKTVVRLVLPAAIAVGLVACGGATSAGLLFDDGGASGVTTSGGSDGGVTGSATGSSGGTTTAGSGTSAGGTSAGTAIGGSASTGSSSTGGSTGGPASTGASSAGVTTGGPASTSASSAGTTGTTSNPYTLDNVCDKTAPMLCQAMHGCCDKAQIGYDDAACMLVARAGCQANVAAVRAGTMDFDPTSVDACLKVLTPYLDRCFIAFDDLMGLVRDMHACKTFTGHLAEGAICDRSEQCQPATAANQWAQCDDKSKTCKTITALATGSACSFGDGVSAFCDSGLYCKIPLTQTIGACTTALGHGVACSPLEPLACGLGYFCDTDTKACTAGRPGGGACSGTLANLQCQSLECSGSLCSTKTFATAAQCRGM